MPVCGNYLFFELPKKIVLNPKDGNFSGGSVFPDNKAFQKLRFARCLKKTAAFFGFTV